LKTFTNFALEKQKTKQNPRFTKFQKRVFPQMHNGARIEFFGPNAINNNIPTGPIYKYNFEIRRYHQYIFPR